MRLIGAKELCRSSSVSALLSPFACIGSRAADLPFDSFALVRLAAKLRAKADTPYRKTEWMVLASLLGGGARNGSLDQRFQL